MLSLLSVAVGAVHVKLAPQFIASAYMVVSIGQLVKLGASVSATVKVKLQLFVSEHLVQLSTKALTVNQVFYRGQGLTTVHGLIHCLRIT